MRFSWHQHIELARAVSLASDDDKGLALAMMGVAMTMLANDLECLTQDDLSLASVHSSPRI